ncbi:MULTISPECIES: undecaprenyl-phosphate glucose phosphotransferase [unclassified Rhizobium]|uniref:undecaprenyl-phosphate glucose phosphotransferase n=1 Tax=unclassified Rhizobium TaxID=2613769 RepID=UPI001618F4CF|nr:MULTISPECIES: undecaprenyl-phosphate glucose phosphotransferase [unclassified Rhizobium]MBB3288359.1 Undecaprenyl-phosphate glucose phosphotransferase [Rhizobium sp. BK252]MBB3402778.1 Undecaprenyl-phosphate glucose phosphotransferase [Rhizobium sp. BK289]MBB3415355.1 Undecaprenyl-phosphate glucose phosphotransferase [Rhizobium sp. BK284]MBB3483565.1 Undecaprenyl-phosphate glucose phosphotransferase [Rhizobium sp. BK347]MDK4723761.1 undecaprenyl-phosphate glucose phosphotransferase [Rhizobi
MNTSEKSEQFNLDNIRKQVSEIRTRDAEEPRSDQPGSLNAYARQIAEQFRETNQSPAIVVGQYRLFEFLSLLALGLATLFFGTAPDDHPFVSKAAVTIALSGLAIVFLQIADAYQIPILRAPHHFLHRILGAWAAAFAVMAIALIPFDINNIYSLHLLGVWLAVGAGFLLVARLLFAYGIRNWARNGIMERRAVIIGGGEPAKELIRALEHQPDNDIRICGIFDDRGEKRSPVMVAGYPKLGTVMELVEFARLVRVDMLIIALPISAEERILQLLKMLWVLPVDIRLAAHANKLRFRPRAYSHVGAVPMLDIFNKPIRDWDGVAKRIFDIFFSLVALALLWPVMLGAAIAVKVTSKGPVFFMQKRHGFNNEIIKVFKFRSMYTHMSDPTARNAVTKNDPRVTPVGRFIRKTSIDELPQLFNVLLGNLSLVGPRPHAVLAASHNRTYADVVEGYFARHRVKPGVTGWAQINGWRGEIDSDDKIKFRTAYDLYYIENWSLLFDLKILFLTPFRLLNTENAY